jgi:hypothetical protein
VSTQHGDPPRNASRCQIAARVALALVALAAPAAHAQPPMRSASAPAHNAGGPAWSALTPAQRGILAPLERDWSRIDAPRKQKWLDIADRVPNMPPDERQRIQERMHEWAKLSPQERGQARLQYQEARQLTPQERQQRWEAYRALEPEQRRELRARAQPASAVASGAQTREAFAAGKSNIVPNPADSATRKAVGPTAVQAKPGATTTLITRHPAPPAHQQSGLPKIAATPDFVDRTTLLPQKGPQGAATQPAPAASAPASPRKP